MALSLDDRLMGERVQCYVSEDEDEVANEVNQLKLEKESQKQIQNQQRPQTGVKGVIEDYNQYQAYDPKSTKNVNDSDSDLSGLSDDEEVFKQYREARMREMAAKNRPDQSTDKPLIEELTLDTYETVANKNGQVVICIYRPNCANSELVLKCLDSIATSNPHVKFAKVNGTLILDPSSQLLNTGLPCLTGNLDGRQTQSLVWVDCREELGEEFEAELLLGLLRERGFF